MLSIRTADLRMLLTIAFVLHTGLVLCVCVCHPCFFFLLLDILLDDLFLLVVVLRPYFSPCSCCISSCCLFLLPWCLCRLAFSFLLCSVPGSNSSRLFGRNQEYTPRVSGRLVQRFNQKNIKKYRPQEIVCVRMTDVSREQTHPTCPDAFDSLGQCPPVVLW